MARQGPIPFGNLEGDHHLLVAALFHNGRLWNMVATNGDYFDVDWSDRTMAYYAHISDNIRRDGGAIDVSEYIKDGDDVWLADGVAIQGLPEQLTRRADAPDVDEILWGRTTTCTDCGQVPTDDWADNPLRPCPHLRLMDWGEFIQVWHYRFKRRGPRWWMSGFCPPHQPAPQGGIRLRRHTGVRRREERA